MTRKHFQALADSLASTKPLPDVAVPFEAMTTWLATCVAIADTCNRFSDNFDRCKFLAACGC